MSTYGDSYVDYGQVLAAHSQDPEELSQVSLSNIQELEFLTGRVGRATGVAILLNARSNTGKVLSQLPRHTRYFFHHGHKDRILDPRILDSCILDP